MNAPIRPRRLGAARHVGQAGPAGRGVLRHHLDRLLRRARLPPSDEMRKVFEVVTRRARCGHQAGDRCRGGRPAAARVRGGRCRARRTSEASGFGEYFTHRTGHSIGVGSARQRRQHGQLREPRRAPRGAVDLLFHRARSLSAGVRRALGNQHVRGRQRRARHGRDSAGNATVVVSGAAFRRKKPFAPLPLVAARKPLHNGAATTRSGRETCSTDRKPLHPRGATGGSRCARERSSAGSRAPANRLRSARRRGRFLR